MSNNKRKPVILDTDIGDWIDDHFALTFLLGSPELDLKMVVTTFGDVRSRAKIVAKTLTEANREDVHVALGEHTQWSNKQMSQLPWVQDYDLKSYKGTVHEDGITAMINLINSSSERITLIAIGPLLNIGRALEKDPSIAAKVDLVAQIGCFGFNGGANFPSWNIEQHLPEAKLTLKAKWNTITVVPYDCAGKVQLTGQTWQRILESQNPVTKALVANHRLFMKTQTNYPTELCKTLFDTAAVYVAFATEWAHIESCNISINETAHTIVDPSGVNVQLAKGWKDLDKFVQFLATRL